MRKADLNIYMGMCTCHNPYNIIFNGSVPVKHDLPINFILVTTVRFSWYM